MDPHLNEPHTIEVEMERHLDFQRCRRRDRYRGGRSTLTQDMKGEKTVQKNRSPVCDSYLPRSTPVSRVDVTPSGYYLE